MDRSGDNKLNLKEWGLPEGVLNHYKKRGILQMFPWQAECLCLGSVLEGENLIYSAPTSAGKTLVAEILVSQAVFEKQKKALVILPFVSVVREKMFYFQEMFSENGVRVEGFMGGHTPTASFQQVQVAVCTIEKANSLINRLLEEKNLSKLGIVVVDELHLLGDPYRGYILELLLTKLKFMSSVHDDINLQIVGMSATLPNLNALAKWLNARLFFTDFRPVPLDEHLKCGRTIMNKDLQLVAEMAASASDSGDDPENVGELCIDTIRNGHSALIFCPTKAWCESLAIKLASYFRKLGCSQDATKKETPGWILRQQLDLSKLNSVVDHLKVSPAGLDKELAKTVSFGVAFHHAGLTMDERDIIEGSFRKGSLRVLCATSTLSSGVNLPARRVIIRSPMSFGNVMDVMTYRQMIGRAGRMGVDTHGESIIICKPGEKVICQQLMSSGLKPIESCLGSGILSASLKRAVLEVVASGIATTQERLSQYAGSTFLASSGKKSMQDPLTSCLDNLIETDLIRLKTTEGSAAYEPTALGEACLASSLPPDEGLALFRELDRARRCFVLDSDLHIIYQITPYGISEQWAKIDWFRVLSMIEELSPSMKRVADLVGVEDAFLAKVVKGTINPSSAGHKSKLSIHRRFYTCLALHDLVNEVPLAEVALKFNCNKGMLQTLQQNAATYAGMVAEFAKKLRWGTLELIVGQFQERLQFGVQRELCELMKLPSLNGLRARALYNAGITTLAEVANSDAVDLESALLKTTPFQSRLQGAAETEYELAQRARQQAVWVTGRADLSVRAASESLIKEARDILELELGVAAKWGKTDNSSKLERTIMAQPMSQIKKRILSSSVCVKETISPEHNACVKKSNHNVSESVSNNTPTDTISKNLPQNFTNNVVKEPSVINQINNNVATERSAAQVNEDEKSEIMCNVALNDAVTSVLVRVEPNPVSVNPKITNGKSDGNNVNASVAELRLDTICDWDTSSKKITDENDASMLAYMRTTRDMPEIVAFNDNFYESFNLKNEPSLLQESTKRNHRSRFSTDLFDASPKPCSTPLQTSSNVASIGSPDLFSTSLTFDTQLQRVCDSEEMAVFSEDVPSSPPKSDLGYLSDSPVIVAEISTLVNPSVMCTVGESFFAVRSNIRKREASPDWILSDDSLSEDIKQSRKTKKHGLFRSRSKRDLKKPRLETDAEVLGSDDQIASTPGEFRICTRKRSKIDDPIPANNEVAIADLESHDITQAGKTADSIQTMDWETLNTIDVCRTKDLFQCFREDLRQQTIIGLAFGCRTAELVKPRIGANFKKKGDEENTPSADCVKYYFVCEDVCLDGFAVYWHLNNVFYVSCSSSASVVSQMELTSLLNEVLGMTVRMYDSREQLRVLMLCTSTSGRRHWLLEDPKVASWMLSTTSAEENLPSMVRADLPEATPMLNLLGHKTGGGSYALDALSSISPKLRSCCEALLSYRILEKQLPKLRDVGLHKVFAEMEMPILGVLAEMEVEGLKIDEMKVKQIKVDLESHIANLEMRAHKLAGRKFPLSSHGAVAKVLFTEMRLGKPVLTAKTKNPSTSKEALESLERESKHPLPRIILQWRKLQAIVNKTLCHLLRLLPRTQIRGRCQTFTVTGRISMHEPNLQNIPRDFDVELENGNRVHVGLRHIFVAKDGFTFLSADYCQVELRLLAYISQDAALITSITSSEDIFVSIAASLLGKSEDQVTADDRQRAKQTCYGIIYGIGAKSLALQLEINEETATNLMTDFKMKYQGVRKLLENTVMECRLKGYVETMSGRRRHLPAITSENQAIRSEAERQAVNTRVQGSAADIIKRAMLAIRASAGMDFKLVLHLHDELIYQVRTEDLATVAEIVKSHMEKAAPGWEVGKLHVPFPVKVKAGPSWGQLALQTTSL